MSDDKKFKVHTSLSGIMGFNPLTEIDKLKDSVRRKKGTRKKTKIKIVKKNSGGLIKGQGASMKPRTFKVY